MKALDYLRIGIQYLHLVDNVIQETINQNNTWVMTSSEDISWDEYDEKTKWSDFRIIVPVMFDLYHGIELTLKGLETLDNFKKSKNHKLSKLVRSVEHSYPNTNVINFFLKYTKIKNIPDPLKTFFSKSCISINDYYQAFKYPENLEGSKKYLHIELKYKDNEGVEFYSNLSKDIQLFLKELVTLVRVKESKR